MKWLLPLLFSIFTLTNTGPLVVSTDLTVEDHVLTSVNDKSAQEVRIYKQAEVYTIADGAFDDCVFESIMISNTVKAINDQFPTSTLIVNFTGSVEEKEFDVPEKITVNYYACDEGFLNYWETYIRPDITGSICNVSEENYTKMKELYSRLNETDKETVNQTEDGTGTIKDGIKFLDNHFSNSNNSRVKEKEISQSVMITLILVVAAFGMTSIGIFYILKDKKVID